MLPRLSRLGPAIPRLLCNAPARFVSQSKPTGSTSAISPEIHARHAPHGPSEVSPFVKNPDYHGFSDDPTVDEWNMRLAFFFGISLTLVVGGTFIAYLPDHKMKGWSRREAERVIVQRERDGLPLISADYHDPSTIILPSVQED